MSHCPGCDDPNCQGTDHKGSIVIDEDEFRKIIFNIKRGINNHGSSAAIQLAKIWLTTLEGYDINKPG